MGYLLSLASIALLFFSPTLQGAKGRAIKFKSSPIAIQAAAGQPLTIDLKSLLAETGTGNLTWTASAEKPAWMILDSVRSLITGTATLQDQGAKSFRLGVGDGDSNDFTQINLTVVLVPQWKHNPLDLGLQNEDRPWKFDLKTEAVHPKTGGKLTFSAKGLLPWMALTADGILSGTPGRNDVRKYDSIELTATTESGGAATTRAFGEVLKTLKGPRWKSNPLVLAATQEDSPFSEDLSAHVEKFEQQAIKFEVLGQRPNWLKLSSSGVLAGVPRKGDVGPNKLTVRVSAASGADNTVVQLQVDAVNHPPEWLANPVVLPDGAHGIPYSQSLRNSVNDVDKDPLSFELVEGPSWATLSKEGTLAGTPTKKDVGNQDWIVSVSDGTTAVRSVLKVLIRKSNEPPVWIKDPTELPNGTEEQPYTQNLISYVSDPDRDALTFKLISGPNWISLSSQGLLTGTPSAQDGGQHKLRVKVTDNKAGAAEADVVFSIDDVNHAPKWTLSPVQLTIKEEDPFQLSLVKHVSDSDKDPLTFSLLSGPAWITFNQNGTLSGTPGKKQVGANRFVVRAEDGKGGSADGEVVVTVTAINHPPSWLEDPIALADGKELEPYAQNISAMAKDIDGDPLTFELVSGPTWVKVDKQGGLSGIPQKGDHGVIAVRIRVRDNGNQSAVVTARFSIEKINTGPKWTKLALALGETIQDEVFLYNVAPFAVDDEGDRLTFKLLKGPAWLYLSAAGQLSGKPAKSDVGPFVAKLEVSDGTLTAEVDAQGKVLSKNAAPEITSGAFQFSVKEREISTRDLKPFAADPDGDPITFALVAAGSWATLSPDGKLQLEPKYAQIGDHTFLVRVSDGVLQTEEELKVRVLRSPRAPEWQEKPLKVTGLKNAPMTGTLSGKAKDLDGVPLSYSKVSGPTWLTIASDGTLGGNPDQSGEANFVVAVKNDLLSAEADLVVLVASDNKAPSWTKSPVKLAEAREGRAYAESVVTFVKDPNPGDTFTFSKLSGPNWAYVSSSGTILGTPQPADMGQNSLTVRVKDNEGLTADAEVIINVRSGNLPPRFTKDPVLLGEVALNQPFAFDLSEFAADPDGDALQFRKISGPGWLSVSPAGQVMGTPGPTDFGGFTTVFEVTDGKLAAQAGGLGKVVNGGPANRPPVIAPNIVILAQVGAEKVVALNAPQYVSDPDNDPLQFQLVTASDWAAISASGELKVSPQTKHLGESGFQLKVSDGKLSTTGNFTIRVVQTGGKPPVWLEDPVRLEARINSPLNSSLAAKAKDPNSLPLTFSKVGGPAWLTISGAGALQGTPGVEHEGENRFSVSVTNGSASADAELILTVKPGSGDQSDVVTIDAPVANAPVEVTWVVDNSWLSRFAAKGVSNQIGTFFTELSNTGIKATHTIQSANVRKWDGFAVTGSDGKFAFASTGNAGPEFTGRMNDAFSQTYAPSLVWQFFRFQQRLPQMPEIYQSSSYYVAGVPLEAVFVTQRPDYWKVANTGTPQAGYTIGNYTRDFANFHRKENKAFRVHALVGDCAPDDDCEEEFGSPPAPRSIYGQLADNTGGKTWTITTNESILTALKDLAKQIAFRANVNAKRTVNLTAKPASPAAIKVLLSGKSLAASQWSYDATNNRVAIKWALIDQSQLAAGDKLEVIYAVAK